MGFFALATDGANAAGLSYVRVPLGIFYYIGLRSNPRPNRDCL